MAQRVWVVYTKGIGDYRQFGLADSEVLSYKGGALRVKHV
jgi:hypothetical protein